MRLNLGCSDRYKPGYINVDLSPECVGNGGLQPGYQFQFTDLRKDWPWPDSSVDHIVAEDIIEHLPDKVHTMNEAWRVLRPEGVFDIDVPTTDGPGAWQDPTHVSCWNRNSFFYYTDGDDHRRRFGRAYKIQARFRVLEEHLSRPGGVPKLRIRLAAVK